MDTTTTTTTPMTTPPRPTEADTTATTANATTSAMHSAAPVPRRRGLALAVLLCLGLGGVGWYAVQQMRQAGPPVALHHLHVEHGVPAGGQSPAQGPTPTPGVAPAPPPVAVLPLPADASVPAAVCAPWLARWAALSRPLCEQAQLAPSGAQSVRGRPIAWRDVAPPASQVAPRRVLVIGAMHGDELTSAALALHWVPLAQQALAQEGRAVHWRFIPVLNPDGLLARPATRTNASGVDLNRNFPTADWERDAPLYWDKRTRRDPRRWPGPAPLSEPESQFLHAQMQAFDPDLVVSIHAPYGVLDFDGPQTPPQKLGPLQLDQLGVFPGSLGNYGGKHLDVPVVTIELHHALRMPVRSEIHAMWRDLLAWMDRHLPAQTAR